MRYYLLTLGCPKNQVDSEGMRELLEAKGFREVPQPSEADILIVNTCGFIAPAIEESLGELRKLARSKKKRQKLIAAGCLAERDAALLAREVPKLDAALSTRQWTQIVPLVERLSQGERSLTPATLTAGPPPPPIPRRASGASAYLKIAEGCDASCAFCTIPRIKGGQRSKPPADILQEARELAAKGAKEAILIAQDTTAYGHDLGMAEGLAHLIEAIVRAVPELPWLRVMYGYPQRVTPRLIEAMAGHPQVCHYLDIPLQHAHPEVLRRMGRPHSPEAILRLVADLRSAMPDIALRTTFIAGYPGETEAEFATLLDFVREAAFDWVGVFPYCQEEGTPAAELPGQPPAEVKEERRCRAMELALEITRARNEAQVGREMLFLIEGAGDGLSVGRTYRQAPEVDGLVLLEEERTIGKMLPVRITHASDYDLWATASLASAT